MSPEKKSSFGSLLEGLQSDDINAEENMDAESLKLREIDNSSLVPARPLTGLDATWAKAYGLDLVADAKYSP